MKERPAPVLVQLTQRQDDPADLTVPAFIETEELLANNKCNCSASADNPY